MILEGVFAGSLLVMLVVERLSSAVGLLLYALAFGDKWSSASRLRRYASVQVLGAGASFGVTLASGFGAAVVSAISSLLSLAFWALVFTVVLSGLYIVQERDPGVMIFVVDYWNTTLGPVYELLFLTPLWVVESVFGSILPIWNGVFFVLSRASSELLTIVVTGSWGPIEDMGAGFEGVARASALSVSSYVQSMSNGCSGEELVCYDPGRRMLDLVSPLGQARGIAVGLTGIFYNLCRGASGPVDVALYPFRDINFAKGVHGIVNGLLYPILQMPIVTAERCKRGGGGLVWCIPDFEPGFNMLTVGFRSLGLMLDNWLDVTSVIVQKSIGLDPGLDCDQVALAITPLNKSVEMFGSNQTTVVGLTEGLYAVTDGYSIQYFDHYDSVSSILSPGAWPVRVDPRLGVAAVTFLSAGGVGGARDSVGNPSTTMLGCRCDDVDGEMRIRCGLALYEASAGQGGVDPGLDQAFDVVFHQRSTATQMTCSEAEISVQSVRWPARRFVDPLVTEADMQESCTGRGSCTMVDATIWVQPRCLSGKGANQRICRSGNNLASCFPYCMAARRAGSAADGLVLYSASEWKNKVHLYERDCSFSYLVNPSGSVSSGAARYELTLPGGGDGGRLDAEVVTLNDVLGGSVRINEWDPVIGGCRQSRSSLSNVGVDAMPSYIGGRFPSLPLPGQPFSFAGDTTLTTVRKPNGDYSVRVDRLYGDQSNEFTIINVLKDFPSTPPSATQWIGATDVDQGDALRIPYAFSDESGIRHPSVSTQAAVYFVVNPSTAMFEGFNEWCNGNWGVMQLSALSSYSALRMWRIDPYSFCPNEADGSEGCGTGRVRFQDVPGGLADGAGGINDYSRCSQEFTARVTSLEYLNADNIAVSYLSVVLADMDIATAEPLPGKGMTKITYYNPASNTFKETPWQKPSSLSSTSEGRLCPAMRRLPQLGSFVTETLNVALNLVRFVVRLSVGLPSLIDMWSKGMRCPMVTRGHTLLERCGSEVLSLDEAFDSLERASSLFWGILFTISSRIREINGGGSIQDTVASVVRGAAMWANENIVAIPWVQPIVMSARLPVESIGGGFLSSGGLAGTMMLSTSPLGMARYTYTLVSGWVIDLLPVVIGGASRGEGSALVARKSLSVVVNRFTDSRVDFDRMVLASMKRGCAGMSLMMGYSNPISTFLRKSCEAIPESIGGLATVFTSVTFVVPFVHCVCVDSPGTTSEFERYATDNCYEFAPDTLKGFILDVIYGVRNGGSQGAACRAMIDYARDDMEGALQPLFSTLYLSAEALGPSLDYFVQFVDPNEEGCMRFESNPYATVLMPEPLDFWTACSATEVCRGKCHPEITGFESALEATQAKSSNGRVQLRNETITRVVESRMFVDGDQDSVLPFQILAMVELESCESVCGGAHSTRFAAEFDPGNADTCVAVAGLTDALEIRVQKYCVPRALGLGVRQQDSEAWTVAGSGEFSGTVMQVFFADTSKGDTLIMLRDNTGTGFPGLDLVTVHPRSIQGDPISFEALYGNQLDRDNRLSVMTLQEATSAVAGSMGEVTSVVAMHVIPSGLSGTRPWVFVRVQTVSTGFLGSGTADLCWPVDEPSLIRNLGRNRPPPRKCGTNLVMGSILERGMSIVSSVSVSPEVTTLVLLPTSPRETVGILRLRFSGATGVRAEGDPVYVGTSKGFAASSGIPQPWGGRGTPTFGPEYSDAEIRAMVTASGVVQRVGRVSSQNCLQDVTVTSPAGQGDMVMLVFASGDTLAKSSWLSQSRITLPTGASSFPSPGGRVATAQRASSMTATVTATVTLGCDLYSCSGCPAGTLQSMCYSAQRCTVQRCIGTSVNQRRPLCNAGYAMQKVMESLIAAMSGAWIVLTETYGTIMRISLDTEGSRNLRIASLDEAFYGQVCTLKDLLGASSAMITSIGGSVALSPASGGRKASVNMMMGASEATDRMNAETTMLLNGVNSFLYQLLLAPLFAAVAMQKTMVCGGNSILAVVDNDAFTVRIGRASFANATDLVAGVCLSSTASACADNPGEFKSRACIGAAAQSVSERVTRAATSLLSVVLLEPLTHSMDAFFAYLQGVVSGAQDLAQVADAAHCSVPDYYLNKAVTCACGDTAVQIPAVNRSHGIQEFAHWCTGTLRMVNPFGGEIYVYNPHSYEYLITHPSMRGADEYLLCLSRNADDVFCSDGEPWVPGLSEQGVSALAVVQRCRDNYNLAQWDEGAWLLYDRGGAFGAPQVAGLAAPRMDGGVAACLLSARARGEPTTGCMQDFLAQDSKKAYRYESISDELRDASSLNIAACRIFTGPATNPDPEVAAPYKQCAVGFEETQCTLPLIAWSGGSANRLPVANEHVVDSTTTAERAANALSDYQEVYADIMPKLRALEDFTDDNLNVILFSADGDVLHQAFDCMVLGPYSRVDLWSNGGVEGLPVPTWARDASGTGETRRLDTPCTMEKLDGDSMPPFTCGSTTRRTVIKHFVRDFINGRRGGGTLTEKAIQAKIKELMEVWGDVGRYGCDCETVADRALHGDQSPYCCRAGNATLRDNFSPRAINDISFDIINASEISKLVLDTIPEFWEDIHTAAGNDAFYRHQTQGVAGGIASWRWEQGAQASRRAVDAGLLWWHGDILTWGVDEVGAPFRDQRTLWETCTGLVSQNMFNMPMKSVQGAGGESSSSSPGWTIRDVEALGLDFDLAGAQRGAGNGTDEPTTSTIERYVSRLLASTYTSSPLFWHHALRHAPSESLVCKRSYEGTGVYRAPGDRLVFENRQNIPVASLSGLPPIPVRGYAAYPLGSAGVDCMCGWPRGATSGLCTVPPDVCSGAGLGSCEYGDSEAAAVEAAVLEGWQAGWVCPEMDFSDSWGVVPPSRVGDWLEGVQSVMTEDVSQILTNGRAGLRGGNARTLASEARKVVTPDRRVDSLVSRGGARSSVSLECIGDVLARADATGMATQIVDDLFPASRAVQESQVSASCLRLAIEHARLRVLQMLSGVRDTSVEVGAQASVVSVWRQRCSSQLDMMGMCRANGVFQMVPKEERTYRCPFAITSPPYSERAYYVTSGCLVYKASDDSFYDPCLQESICSHEGSEPAGMPLSSVVARVPFDPRLSSRGLPIGYWPIRFDTARGGEGGKDEELTSLAASLEAFDGASEIPRSLSPAFVEGLVRGGGEASPGYANSPAGGTWGTAEGMSGAGMRFCDALADWWPDDLVKPVGYHVTLPCHHSESGYRTFDTAFAIDTSEGDTIGLIKMVHQSSLLRDGRAMSNEYGASGFCRTGTYGMPRDITNTMRACTRSTVGAEYDPSVPVAPVYGPSRSTSPVWDDDVRCAGTPYETPWVLENPDAAPASMEGVGHVPMWNGMYTGALAYPTQEYDPFQRDVKAGTVRPADGPGAGSCHQGSLLRCQAASDCVPTSPGAQMECFRGVCVLHRGQTSTCYSHADCAASGKMCTGDGYCMDPLYQVENRRDEDIEFQSYASDCSAAPGATRAGQEPPDTFDMFGASPWERVPDILEMHGMCGYRKWFEYREFVARGAGGASNAGSLCGADGVASGECRSVDYKGDKARWWDSGLPDDSQVGFASVWAGGRFRVQPHACDRDYMHVQGMMGCAPTTTVSPLAKTGFVSLSPSLVRPTSTPLQNPRASVLQTYDKGRYVPIIKMNRLEGFTAGEWESAGFMSIPDLDGNAQGNTPFVPCSSVKHCLKDRFDVAGVSVKRMTRQAPGAPLVEWQQSWSTACGMFGVEDAQGRCTVDSVAAPLYWALCPDPGDPARSVAPWANAGSFLRTRAACGLVGGGRVASACGTIRDSYAGTPSVRQLEAARQAMNALIDAFSNQDTDIASHTEYMDKVACSQAIYDSVQDDPMGQAAIYNQRRVWSFHLFLKHTTVEIPMALWHKCVLMSGRTVTLPGGGVRSSVHCDAWSDSISKDAINRTDYTVNPLRQLLRTDGVISRPQADLVRLVLAGRVQEAVLRYKREMGGPGMFNHRGITRDTGMVCHTSPRYRPRSEDPLTPDHCWTSLIRWAQASMGAARDWPEQSSWDPRSRGVMRECYEYADPFLGVSDMNPEGLALDGNHAVMKQSIENAGYNPRPFNSIEALLLRNETSSRYVREVDFLTTDVPKESFSRTGGHGLVTWEFEPPNLGKIAMPRAGVGDEVSGALMTNLESVRWSMRDSIPCVSTAEVAEDFPCDPSAIGKGVDLDVNFCYARKESLTNQIRDVYKDSLEREKVLQGELRKGVITTGGLSQVEKGLIYAFTGGIGRIVTLGLDLSGKLDGQKERVDKDELMMLWPDELKDVILTALQDSTDYCLAEIGSRSGTYCQTEQQRQMESQTFSILGADYLAFKAKLLTSEFDVLSSEDEEKAYSAELAKLGSTARIQDSDDTGETFLADGTDLQGFIKRLDTPGVPGDFSDDKETLALLAKAMGGAEEARSILERRRQVMDTTLRNIESIVAAVSHRTWYDCSAELGKTVCISSPTEKLNPSNFHSNMRNVPTDIQEVNGNWGAILDLAEGAAASSTPASERDCLWMGLPSGSFNCRWYERSGLDKESERLRRLSYMDTFQLADDYLAARGSGDIQACRDGHRFRHPVSGRELSWGVDCSRVLAGDSWDTDKFNERGQDFKTTQNTDSVTYTVYARFVAELMNPEPDVGGDPSRPYTYTEALSILAPRVFPAHSPIFDLPDGGAFSPKGAMSELDLEGSAVADDVIDGFQQCVDGALDAESYETCVAPEYRRVLSRAAQDTDQYLRREGPVVLKPFTALVWDGLHSSHFTSPSVPSWASASRASSDVYARWLLDADERCKEGSPLDAVCFRPTGDGAPLRSVNPWVGGSWNPYQGCDTKLSGTGDTEEVVDSHCYEEVCPDRSIEVPFYQYMPNPDPQMQREGQWKGSCYSDAGKRAGGKPATELGVSRLAPENICFRKPAQSLKCDHAQGMLGGLNGSAVADLYLEGLDLILSPGTQALQHAGIGLFMHGGNPAYFTTKGSDKDVASAVHWALNAHADDLGGHHIVVSVGPAGVMHVDRLPLGRTDLHPGGQWSLDPLTPSEIAVMNSAGSSPTHGEEGWLSTLKDSLDRESVPINRLYPPSDDEAANRTAQSPAQAPWSCPLQVVALWNGLDASVAFNPLVPSPLRTARLFGGVDHRMTMGTRAHPTMRVRELSNLAQVHTSNGFCVCENPLACRIPRTSWGSSPCGLPATIEHVMGNRERELVDLDSVPCGRQMDWPFIHGDLRDGMAMEGRYGGAGATETCNVMDRVPDFKVSFRTGGVVPNPSGTTTLHEGGACHMGRAPHMPRGAVELDTCTTISRNSTHVTAKCMRGDSGTPQILEMARVRSAIPPEMLSSIRTRRRECRGASSTPPGPQGQCTAPPAFLDDTMLNQLPKGAEVSYGIPFRWSAARMLAADVRRSACGGDHVDSPECAALVSSPAWGSAQGFMDAFLGAPEQLLPVSGPPPGAMDLPLTDLVEPPGGSRPDEDLLWDGPDARWVFCDQETGECFGNMSSAAWSQARPVERMGMCRDVITENMHRARKAAAHLNICDLNDRLDSLCRVLQSSRQKLMDANCQMTGACSPSEHVYTPGLYSTTNGDFARGTVQNFYELFNPKIETPSFVRVQSNEDLVCTLDPGDLELRVQNDAITTKCASRELERVQDVLKWARVAVNKAVQISYAMLNIVLSILRIIVDQSDRDGAIKDLRRWGHELGTLLLEAFEALANMVFEAIFGTGMGQAVKELLYKMCMFVQALLDFEHTLRQFFAGLVATILEGINQAIEFITLGAVRIAEIDTAVKKVRAWGEDRKMVHCEEPDYGYVDIENLGVLPVPTRCYMEYISSIDDGDSLSCTRSDTCRQSDLSFGVEGGNDPVLCGACPIAESMGTVVQFGCDSLTKQCTCGAAPRPRTTCTANYQCYLSESMCDLVADPSTGSPSGGVSCRSCSSQAPVCLVTDGGLGVGVCACLIRDEVPTKCDTSSAALDRVVPMGGAMCAVSLDAGVSRQSSGSLDWNSLAAAPCALIGESFCFAVQGKGLLAVGMGVVGTGLFGGSYGRRMLLSSDGDAMSGFLARVNRFDEWNRTAQPCAGLVEAFLRPGSSLGVTDSEALVSCVRWREVAVDIILSENITELRGHDYMLLSLADMSRAMSHKGVVGALLANPKFLLKAASYHPWVTPVLGIVSKVAIHVHTARQSSPGGGNLIQNTTTLWLDSILGANRSTTTQEWVGRAKQFASTQGNLMGVLASTGRWGNPVGGGGMAHGVSSSPGAPGAQSMPTLRAERAAPGELAPPRRPKAAPASPLHALPDPPGRTRRTVVGGRSLLQSEEASIAQVRVYSGLVAALGQSYPIPIGGALGDIWLEGPVGWPPRFEYWTGENQCSAGSMLIDLIRDTFSTIVRAYSLGLGPGRFPTPPISIAAQIPRFYTGPATNSSGWPPRAGGGDWTTSLYEFFGSTVLYGLFGITPSGVASFFGVGADDAPQGHMTIGLLARELLVCDLESTTLCTRHERNILVSLALSMVLFLVLDLALSSLGLGVLSSVLFLLVVPALTLYLTYGYSPLCAPQVPVCLIGDVLNTLSYVLPPSISWPNALQVYPGCINGTHNASFPAVSPGTGACLLSCVDAPFHFVSWERSLAWAACGVSQTCEGTVVPLVGTEAFSNATRDVSAVLSSGDPDLIAAHSYCFTVTLVRVLPWILLLVLALAVLVASLRIPIVLVTAWVQFMVQGVSYTHSGA